MTVNTSDEFLSWAADHGIQLDPRFSAPQTLLFPENRVVSKERPATIDQWKQWVTRLMNLLANEGTWVWRRGGTWRFPAYPEAGDAGLFRRAVQHVIQTLGIREGDQALHFRGDEHQSLIGLAVLMNLISTSVTDDLFMIPDSAAFILWFDHDGYVHIYTKTEQDSQKLELALLN